MRVLWIACAFVIASASRAGADGAGVIAVSTDADRVAVAASVAAAASDGRAVRAIPDAVAVARGAILAGAVPVATLERFRHVREQIDEGWRAYLRVQIDFAASRLAAARTQAESLVALPGGAALYADASLRLGAVLGHLDRTADAQAALALALALDPDRPISQAEFSPDVVAAVDAVRALPHPARSIHVVTEPPGAVVEVDGADVGHAPLDLELAVGQHVIAARLPQFQPRALAAVVDDTTRELALDLDRDPDWSRVAEGATPGLADAAAQQLVDATIRFADLDEVVLAAESDRRGGPTLLVQRCAGLPARCTAVVEVGYTDPSGLAAAAREAWQAARGADLRYPPSVFADPRVTGKKVEHHCKVCRSPWLWGSIGTAAVIGTIVVIAIATSSTPPPVVGVDPTQYSTP